MNSTNGRPKFAVQDDEHLESIDFALGLVTYLWGKDWDLPTLIANCEATNFAGVELRSTHKHGVEVTLSPQ